METLLLMAKSAKGVSASKLIEKATAAKDVFVFAELLDMPNIAALAENPQYSGHLTLLQLFSYGTYSDYKQNQAALPALNPTQLTKIRQLSIVTLAAQSRILPYAHLQSTLEVASIRALEDLIIDAIYSGLVRGKLDQKHQQFEVEWTMGRDLRPGQLEELLGALQEWSDRTASVLTSLETQLVQIETQESDAKSAAAAHDMTRKGLVADLVAYHRSNNNNSNPNNNNSQSQSSNRDSQSQRKRPTRESYNEDAMDVDLPTPPGSFHGTVHQTSSSTSRKKQPSSGGGGAPNTRKRVRGGG